MAPEEIFFAKLPPAVQRGYNIKITDRADRWQSKSVVAFCKCCEHSRFNGCTCAFHGTEAPGVYQLIFDAQDPTPSGQELKDYVARLEGHLRTTKVRIKDA